MLEEFNIIAVRIAELLRARGEKIAVAETIGHLSLALRSIADNNAELEDRIARGEIKLPADADPKAERRLMLEIASIPVDNNTSVTVGADVSRFQRGSVPDKPGGDVTAAPAPNSAPTGPIIRVARGNNVTVNTVGAK